MRELLEDTIKKFNEVKDEGIQRELSGVVRKVQIELSDGPWYNFTLRNGKITGLVEGNIEDPDVRIISDKATIMGLLKKEIKPIKAWATKKLRIKAPLEDILRLRKFLKG